MGTIIEQSDSLQLLVDKAKAGDCAAFDELIDRSRSRLESYVGSRIGGDLARRVEVHDIVQDVSLRAFKSLGDLEFRGGDAFVSWLCGIARHVIWETASRFRRDRPVPLDFDVDTEDASPSQAMRRDERFDRLQQAVDSLQPEYREVILLVRIEGLAVKDVATKMNRSPHAVSNLLLRATRKLKETMGDTASFGLPDRKLERGGGERDV